MTNAQFPEQMETLRPCTQLYISVDAPTAPDFHLFEMIDQHGASAAPTPHSTA